MNFLKDPNKMKFISLIVAVIGLLLILNSPRLGVSSVSSWVRSVGGSVDSQEYLQMLKGYINAYKTVGAIFLFTGLFSILNKNDNK
ncbi:hypothetical protein [Geobacillus jurassicus]|uniref:Uncharacterized protein n=1 Tax=Geobacillus jurassicus TaxID=235932 RepID=A0ABV6GR37_9BACL|nr:hypothetical protein [Geobacillus jurassicus]